MKSTMGACLAAILSASVGCGSEAPGPSRSGTERAGEAPAASSSGAPGSKVSPSAAPANSAAQKSTRLGPPTATTHPELEIQRWAQEGGGRETVRPTDGEVFLVLQFLEAPAGPIAYNAREFELIVEGGAIPPHAVTSSSANPRDPNNPTSGPAIFQREVWMTEYTPAPGAPFAVAFLVPSGTRSGELSINGTRSRVDW